MMQRIFAAGERVRYAVSSYLYKQHLKLPRCFTSTYLNVLIAYNTGEVLWCTLSGDELIKSA